MKFYQEVLQAIPISNILISMLLCGLCVILFKYASKKDMSRTLEPPGPKGLVFALYTLRYFTISKIKFLELIVSLYEDWVNKDTLNPIGFRIGNQQFYLLTNPRQISKMFRDDKNFVKTKTFIKVFTQVLGHNLVTVSEDEDWKPMRARTKQYFNSTFMSKYNEITREVLDKFSIPKMMEMAKSGEELDVWEEMKKTSGIISLAGFLGNDVDSIDPKFCNAVDEIFDYVRQRGFSPFYLPIWIPTPDNLQLIRNQKMLRDMLLSRIETDKDKPTMFGEAIRANTNSNGLVDIEKCLQETISNLVGGSETTIIFMTWACYYVARDMRLQDRLYKEIIDHLGGQNLSGCNLSGLQLLDNILYETLRLKSPSYLLTRSTANDVEFGGYLFKKDAIVITSQYISHRLPKFWKNPHKFDPDRYVNNDQGKNNLFPFGGGKYLCIGNQFAFQEARFMFVKVLLNFKMYPGKGLDEVGESYKITLRPDRPLLVKLVPRVHN